MLLSIDSSVGSKRLPENAWNMKIYMKIKPLYTISCHFGYSKMITSPVVRFSHWTIYTFIQIIILGLFQLNNMAISIRQASDNEWFSSSWVMFLASLIQQDPIIRLTFCLMKFSLECSTPLVKRSCSSYIDMF